MNRQGLSWKAKLKFAIDQVVKESVDFEDFLRKCKAQNIKVAYNPMELFPSGNVPTPESMEKKRNALSRERSIKHDEYLALKEKVTELEKSRKTVDDYLRNQRDMQKKRKKDDLE